MKNVLLAFIILSFSLFAQPVKKDFTFYRGDYTKLTYQVNQDVTNYELLFAFKLTKSFSSPRLSTKQNTVAGGSIAEIKTTYVAPFTTIEIFLNPEDTRDLTSKVYYYDLIKTDPLDSTKETTIFTGELKNNLDVINPFDGTYPPTDGSRFYVAGTFIDTTVSDGSVFVWDSTNQTMNAISKDSLWDFLDVSDTVDNAIALEMLDFKNYSLTFLYPTTDEDVLIDRTHRAITIDSIFCSTKDSSVAFNILYASTRNGSATGVFSGNQTITTPTTLTSFANATIPANRYLIFQFSTVAGILNEEFYAKIYYGY